MLFGCLVVFVTDRVRLLTGNRVIVRLCVTSLIRVWRRVTSFLGWTLLRLRRDAART